MIKDVVFPPAGELRARKVSTRARFRPTGKYPSWKMRRMMEFESPHELNAFRLLDCDPQVLRFAEQPCRVDYIDDDGAIRLHYPDIMVEFSGRKELWEVKPDAEAIKPDLARRTALLQSLGDWGYGYKVVRGGELSRQPRLYNHARLLHFGAGREVASQEFEAMRLKIQSHGALNWSEACSGSYGPKGREIVCRLALNGAVVFDTDKAWTPGTRFHASLEAR